MTTLFDVLKKTYLALGYLEISTATGGSKTYISDTKLGEKYGDDELIGSTIMIIRDAGGAGAAPENETSTITAYVQSTNMITFSPALTAVVASGDKYGITKNIIDFETMKEIVNDTLQGLGTIQLADTSITTSADVSEYSLPKGLKYKVNGVQIQTENGTNNNEWNDIGGWYIINSAAGSTGLLCFNESLPTGRTLKLLYESEHPALVDMTDEINETFHSEYVTKAIIDRAFEYQIRRTGGTDSFLVQASNKAMADVREARNKFSQPKRKRPKYLTPYNFNKDDTWLE